MDRDQEALRRLFAPVEIFGGLMLVIASLGLLVNLAALEILRRGDRENLNVRGAALHALARRLAVILHRMWGDGTDFQAQPA